ncbi:MAG: tail fiber domain-containing protein, partial [Candidatus Peribacteraceae bacterium]|nr:tail fiber domain-containing protein [Candidatus Peribacteraceae bacterium]
GVTDDSVGLQAAIDAAGTLGKVIFPKADVEYLFASTLVVPGGQTWEGEVDWSATRTPTSGMSRLRYTGSTLAITSAEIQWINMILVGNTGAVTIPNAGVGLTNTGNLRMVGSSISGFTLGIDSVGGFYHVFDRCLFNHCNTCLDFFIVNNVNFNLCKFTRFDIGLSGSGGAGFANFSQCSMEQWTDQLVQHLAGSIFAVSYDQGYIENYPTIAIAAGLTDSGGTGFYDLANGFTHGRTVTLTKNLISNKGVKRLVNGTANGVTWMKGNSLIMYAAGANVPNEMERIVSLTGQPQLLVMEDSYQFIDGAGTTVATATLAGITTDQISVTVSLGKEFQYLDYDGNRITSGKRRNFVSESDYTLDITDYGKTVEISKSSDAIVTIPTLPEGWWCDVYQGLASPMTFAVGSGLSFINPSAERGAGTTERHSTVTVNMSRTTAAVLTGDLMSSPVVNTTRFGGDCLTLATGVSNTGFGYKAGEALTTGTENVIVGKSAADNSTTLEKSTVVGFKAGESSNSATSVFVGHSAAFAITGGADNVAIGYNSMRDSTTNNLCTSVGRSAMNLCTGDNNTALGAFAGATITTGVDNICIGHEADVSAAGAANQIVIGDGIAGTANDQFSFGKVSNVVSNDFGTDALWSRASDRKLKTNIEYKSEGLDFICSLKVGSWNWKDGYDRCTECTVNGLIYDEVEASEQQFGSWGLLDDKGNFNGLKYEGLIMPLINAIQELKKELEELKASL